MKRTILKTGSLAAIITALAPMLNAHLLEVGPAGYDTWQITGDSDSAASTTRDQVHAVGGQLGLTYLPWVLSVTSPASMSILPRLVSKAGCSE